MTLVYTRRECVGSYSQKPVRYGEVSWQHEVVGAPQPVISTFPLLYPLRTYHLARAWDTLLIRSGIEGERGGGRWV